MLIIIIFHTADVNRKADPWNIVTKHRQCSISVIVHCGIDRPSDLVVTVLSRIITTHAYIDFYINKLVTSYNFRNNFNIKIPSVITKQYAAFCSKRKRVNSPSSVWLEWESNLSQRSSFWCFKERVRKVFKCTNKIYIHNCY